MKYIRKLLVLSLMGSLAFSVVAQEKSTLKIDNVLKNKKFQEDMRISDNEIKAQAGSLSRYSMKFDLSYQGPPVGQLADPEMPNPDNRPRDNRTSLSGYTGLRYRMDSNSAVNASTGLKWYTPYQHMIGEKVQKRRNSKDFELANPGLGYDRTFVWLGTQFRSSLGGSVTTQEYYLDRGQRGSLGLGTSFKHNVFNSRWIVGLIYNFDLYGYNRAYEKTDSRVSRYYQSFIPTLEYKILDSLNFKYSVAYSYANLRRDPRTHVWDSVEPMARIGVGWAISRDVYFNPYLNFFSEHPAWASTSLSFSTVFSIL
ncbi:MAG: hypothetical protein AB7F86_15495 [Bdellovibrionales bacterium]